MKDESRAGATPLRGAASCSHLSSFIFHLPAWRGLLVVLVLLDLALIVVFLEVRQTRLRYAWARTQEQLRAVTHENRALDFEVARARRPDEVARRAARMGVSLNGERGTAPIVRNRRP